MHRRFRQLSANVVVPDEGRAPVGPCVDVELSMGLKERGLVYRTIIIPYMTSSVNVVANGFRVVLYDALDVSCGTSVGPCVNVELFSHVSARRVHRSSC